MSKKQLGILRVDHEGYFRLYEADVQGCWHYDTPCDDSCVRAGAEVRAFELTNAYGPATVRAARLGYDLID